MNKYRENNCFKYNEDIKYLLLSIVLSSIILLITFAASGIFPFGDKTILRVDLYHQYAPFHEELRNKILTGDSLFYSWQGGLGKEFLSQLAYYTASPLSFFIIFFPTKYLPEAILLFTFLKIVLASGIFYYYLKKSFNTDGINIVIFSVMYSCIAYITSFYWNIMWLDSVALFPLVALGIERLIKKGNSKTYLIFITLSIIVNFYIAFLVCVFATIYFLVRLFSDYSIKEDKKIILDRILKFGINSLIGGGLTMFLAIPTVIAISKTATSDTSFPNFEVYKNIYQIITNHFSGARPIILARNEDLPNVYSGILTMILLPVYFANSGIKLKEKVLFGGFIIFMLLCSVLKPLDFLIHGGHFPANLPHRYTFIYSFLLLALAFKAFNNIEKLNFFVAVIFSGVYIAFISFSEFFLVNRIEDIDRVLSNKDIFANIVLIIIYVLILGLYKKLKTEDKKLISNEWVPKVLGNLFCILFFVVFTGAFIYYILYGVNFDLIDNKNLSTLISEKGILFYTLLVLGVILILYAGYILKNFISNGKGNYKCNLLLSILLFLTVGESLDNSLNGFLYNGGTNRAEYTKYIDDTKDLLEYLKTNDTDENKFYRQEFRRFKTINDASLYHYNGFSQFSSLAYGDTSKLIEQLGVAATSNSYRYYDPTPLIDSIFNIKYIMDRDNAMQGDFYTFIKEFGNVSLYRNEKDLSLGFMVNDTITELETEQETPFLTQNEFVKATTDIKEDITEPVYIMNFKFENLNAEQDNEVKTKYSYNLHNEKNLGLIPKVNASLYNNKKQRLFLYIDSSNTKRFKYTIQNNTQDREISTGRSLVDLGVVDSGEIVEIEFTLDRKGEHEKTYRKKGDFKIFAAGFNEEVFNDFYNEVDKSKLIVNEYSSTKIKGNINVLKSGIMFTSIPYDKGWKVYVDGKETNTIPIANKGLIGVSLEEGEHEIVFKYRLTGFYIGVLLSLISLAGLVLYIFIQKKLKK